MNYLGDLNDELKLVGIPRRRRDRIVTEFADHLDQDPAANLGEPAALARQFADELGTRLARRTAYGAFIVLALAWALLVEAFFDGGRLWAGWVGYGHYYRTVVPAWYIATLAVCVIACQVAFVAGSLALLRAYRLRRVPVISAADARVLNRRTAIGLIAGAVTMLIIPLSQVRLQGYSYAWWMHPGVGIAAIVLLLAPLPAVLRAARLSPALDGDAGDVRIDLGVRNAQVTPWRLALTLSAMILVVLTLIGVHSQDLSDGLLRGLCDAAACITGFIVLGPYLGLRTTG